MALRRENLFKFDFIHPTHNMYFDIRVSHSLDDPPAGCGLVCVSPSATGIVTWETRSKFPGPLNAKSAFLGKTSSDCLDPMGQLSEQQWCDRFRNTRILCNLKRWILPHVTRTWITGRTSRVNSDQRFSAFWGLLLFFYDNTHFAQVSLSNLSHSFPSNFGNDQHNPQSSVSGMSVHPVTSRKSQRNSRDPIDTTSPLNPQLFDWSK
jgi:hypothetical protein